MLFLLLLLGMAFGGFMCPAIIKSKLPGDLCLNITISFPRIRTIIIDDCADDELCDYNGVTGGFVWPQS
jgi:hypothetical protein